MPEWPYSDLLPLLRGLCDSLSKALNETPDEGDPIKECEQELQRAAVNTTEAEYIRAQAYGQLCKDHNFSDAPLRWRRLYEEACLHIAHIHTRCAIGNAESETSWWKQGRKPQPDNTPKEQFIKDVFRLRWLDDVVAALDMAIIMVGAPKRREIILNGFLPMLQEIATVQDRVAAEYDHHLGTTLVSGDYDAKNGEAGQDANSKDDQERPPKKRRRLSPPASNLSFSPYQITYPPLTHPLPRLDNPSLEEFQQRLNADHREHQEPLPLAITGSIEHWPARQPNRWNNPQYLLNCMLNGRRLVPIETGRSYTDDGWGQSIIPFRKFLGQFVDLSQVPGSCPRSGEDNRDGAEGGDEIDGTVYLAQHDLLSQIPAFREDISIPDYCYSEPPAPRHSHMSSTSSDSSSKVSPGSQSPSSDGDLSEPKINAWLGPADTISPLHTDPHHNILAQVVGRKYVRLYSPRFTANLYPRESEMVGEKAVDMSNTSQIDLDIAMLAIENKQFGKDACEVDDDDAESDGDDEGNAGDVSHETTDRSKARKAFMTEFPLFERAEYVEAILEPGDCLFVPKGWWHYVRSLNASFSVSFWWD